MKQQTSLGDFISALYDTLAPGDREEAPRSTSEVVGACTFELLRRQRNRRMIAELFQPSDAPAT
jgi:hypothetical protein